MDGSATLVGSKPWRCRICGAELGRIEYDVQGQAHLVLLAERVGNQHRPRPDVIRVLCRTCGCTRDWHVDGGRRGA